MSDLLLCLPYRYLDRSQDTAIGQLKPGQEATVLGSVEGTRTVPGRRRRFVLDLEDSTGRLSCTWFTGHGYLQRAYSQGDVLAVAGKVTEYRGHPQMVHPEVEPISEAGDEDRIHTGRITPLYRTTADMKASRLTTRVLRRLIHAALEAVEGRVTDPVPETIREVHGLLDIMDAVRRIHFPETPDDVEDARRRLAFEELLCLQLKVGQWRALHEAGGGRVFRTPGALASSLIDTLPFQLTHSQVQAAESIWHDLSRGAPMHRLLQGDVGSGKTLVALLAMLPVVEAGAQAALMVPTELLAEQHAHTLGDLTRPHGLEVCLLTSRLDSAERRQASDAIASGKARLVVGTHALVQEAVDFHDLGLVVVDEQHRFGVLQRAALREKGANAHLLVMTATPIPRSLALTLYGDLDVTVIDELPPGRLPVKTGWREANERGKAMRFLAGQVAEGGQGFLVYPTIDGSAGGLQAASRAYEALADGPLGSACLGLLHGRMAAAEQEAVMSRFRDGTIDVLVCTTVVEVGVDVPNASVMMVSHAERFGLSQLHQLRGRVGRGGQEAYCILMAEPADSLTPQARERLEAMARSTDGFEIAEMDLKIRGPGQVFGTRQAGFPEFQFADLARDVDVISKTREVAQDILADDPRLDAPEHRCLKLRVDALEGLEAAVVEEAG